MIFDHQFHPAQGMTVPTGLTNKRLSYFHSLRQSCVAVTIYNDIKSRYRLCQLLCRYQRTFVNPNVRKSDHHIMRCPQLRHQFFGHRNRVSKSNIFYIEWVGLIGSFRRSQSHHRYLDTIKLIALIRAEDILLLFLVHEVCTQHRKIQHTGQFHQPLAAKVKIVISRRHGIIAGQIHQHGHIAAPAEVD